MDLSEKVLIYFGAGVPTLAGEQRLIDALGANGGRQAAAAVQAALAATDEVPVVLYATWSADRLVELASAILKAQHPSISADALRVIKNHWHSEYQK